MDDQAVAEPAVTAAPVRWFEDLRVTDVPVVGGKNASLGEMISALTPKGIAVPPGFATTADAYRAFVRDAGIEAPLKAAMAAYRSKSSTLEETGEAVRRLFLEAELPAALTDAVAQGYRRLSERVGKAEAAVAVRSSATAEDLPDASFAGQQETFLNIVGERALIDACRRCYASLFTDRAIAYREAKGFDHLDVALSIGIQAMVRSDLAGSGVMFSIDPDSGFPRTVVISAAWGLGETVVQGSVDPDRYMVFKPLLDDGAYSPIVGKELGEKAQKLVYGSGGSARTSLVATTTSERRALVLDDDEVLLLARWAAAIEAHYGRPMDMEWAKDGETGKLFIVQARPETVQSTRSNTVLRNWRLDAEATPVASGAAVGDSIASGPAYVVHSTDDLAAFPEGAIMIAATTDPDWVPAMRRAKGIVTDHGGPTSHAAIVARELGVPAVVGTSNATHIVKPGEVLTLSCAEGDRGKLYRGALPFSHEDIDIGTLPDTATKLMVNIASPSAAFRWWRLPAKGIGLARMEFIIGTLIRVHPMALVHPERVEDAATRSAIAERTRGFADPKDYFVDTLAQGIARIASAYHPHPVIVRLSDFKSNEYAHLLGGADFEEREANPMIGFRGASRYYHERYREGFALECAALKRVRETMGFTNVVVMVPFCRTLGEADKVLAEMSKNGLARGDKGLQVYVMAEIPANIVLAEEFAKRFDGFSIGSNDLTQLTLGIDRDSDLLAPLFDERDPAVTRSIASLIARAHECGAKVGICGQAPSNYPEFAAMLVEHGIDSISLNPDSFVTTLRHLAKVESARDVAAA
ncbi:phosphoenolpyruvate synthase [Stakelama marina]|uniref:Phosphoenolpyruvate synthase n=1 Tax=Stakelama marina TaxID=2826939 RepID=A0A8T4IBU9_9SPHN|nr:phosphoenolpyruvate synthase [Stakelama marina]MBR0551304.1 phosphoenolpyruvate synthase [Stakelama marina]